MRVILPIKEEYSDSDGEYSDGFSSNSNSNSNSGIYNFNTNVSNVHVTRVKGLTSLDGVHTGVPTLTTPTITPTTLRNIEQTFIELQQDTDRPQPHHNEAGFVPPPVDPVTHVQSNKGSFSDNNTIISTPFVLSVNSTIAPLPVSTMNRQSTYFTASTFPETTTPPPAPTRRNVGGRRPAKSNGLSPEEEERRTVRRERNKLAAARCRKRRLDHTNELLLETQELEDKKMHLQNQIKELQTEEDQLELLLEAHASNCRLRVGTPPSPPEYKPIIYNTEPRIAQSHIQPRCDAATAMSMNSQNASPRRPQLGATATAGGTKPSRPSSLPVSCKPLEIAGVAITTPSSVIPYLNFQSLMDGGTGLTPVGLCPIVPSCSSQQRSSGPDVASPDSAYPSKLVSL